MDSGQVCIFWISWMPRCVSLPRCDMRRRQSGRRGPPCPVRISPDCPGQPSRVGTTLLSRESLMPTLRFFHTLKKCGIFYIFISFEPLRNSSLKINIISHIILKYKATTWFLSAVWHKTRPLCTLLDGQLTRPAIRTNIHLIFQLTFISLILSAKWIKR